MDVEITKSVQISLNLSLNELVMLLRLAEVGVQNLPSNTDFVEIYESLQSAYRTASR